LETTFWAVNAYKGKSIFDEADDPLRALQQITYEESGLSPVRFSPAERPLEKLADFSVPCQSERPGEAGDLS